MSIFEIVVVALGLSMDAFAVAVSKGLSLKKTTLRQMLVIGLYFGLFQAGMPLIGYFLGKQFADMIKFIDHWIAFGLLAIIGGKMIFESRKKDGCQDRPCPTGSVCSDRDCPIAAEQEKRASLSFLVMLPLAVATSIDALAMGVSFAFLEVNIALAASLIGGITLVLSGIGAKIGSIFGTKLKSHAELIGGIILILMGVKILFEHLGVF